MIKSNKPRGAVKLDKSNGSPVISKTANPMRAEVNQRRGPTTGNHGNTTKQGDFLAEKSNRNSYFQQMADMVMSKLTLRGEVHKPHTSPGLEPVAPNLQVRRGPTKGNK